MVRNVPAVAAGTAEATVEDTPGAVASVTVDSLHAPPATFTSMAPAVFTLLTYNTRLALAIWVAVVPAGSTVDTLNCPR